MTAAAVQFYEDYIPGPDLREEVVRGLSLEQKAIPPRFFYDRQGSELFDAICGVPEYYLTRVETAILEAHANHIARRIGPGSILIELGSGASRKVRLLLDALRPAGYLGIDISKDFLLQSTKQLAADYPWLSVHAACADFCQPLDLSYPPRHANKIAFFPGSSIGNFQPDEAVEFMAGLKPLLEPAGALLIGVDLKKKKSVLEAAYNDAQGITAAFNLNLLRRIKRELGAEINIEDFSHQALYNDIAGRIEIYIVSNKDQEIVLGEQRFHFTAGERLHTENSYKYTVDEFRRLALHAGFVPAEVWTDARQRFSVHYLQIFN